MIVKKVCGVVIGAQLTSAERKAMNIEIQKEIAERTRKHAHELDALFLWYLHKECGFGITRLKKAFMHFDRSIEDLCRRYEMTETGDDVWLCTQKLKEIGADIENWGSERGDNE